MNEIVTLLNAALIFIAVEVLANLTVFKLLNKRYEIISKQSGEKIPPWFKGNIERLCLVTGICMTYPQILIAYGALKIGTKLGGTSKGASDKTYTEYYLIGNLISILIAFLTVYLIDKVPQMSFCL